MGLIRKAAEDRLDRSRTFTYKFVSAMSACGGHAMSGSSMGPVLYVTSHELLEVSADETYLLR